MALKNTQTYHIKTIINYFRLWKPIAGLDKIHYTWFKYHLLGFIGTMIRLFLLKLRCNKVIILNPIGVHEVKVLNNDVKVILDYMDVLLDDHARLIKYHENAVTSADGVIFWSKALMLYVTSRYKIKNYTYIPCGIYLKEFNPRDFNPEWFRSLHGLRGKFIVGYSGGVWRDRATGRDLHGIDKLPKIFAETYKRLGDNVVFVVNCPYDRKLFSNFKKFNILHRIVWIKPVRFNDPLRLGLFSSSDVLILTASRFPAVYYAERMKTFEYMASGRAIVAERTPGICGVLKHSYNAYLVELGGVEEIVDAVVKLYDDKELRETLGRNSYEDVRKKYDWNVLAPRYRDFIVKVLSR